MRITALLVVVVALAGCTAAPEQSSLTTPPPPPSPTTTPSHMDFPQRPREVPLDALVRPKYEELCEAAQAPDRE